MNTKRTCIGSLASHFWFRSTILAVSAVGGLVWPSSAAAQPIVTFTSPTNGQQIVTLTNLAGTVTDTASVQQVTFSVYNQSTGQWWNGMNYQGAPTNLPATIAGSNWMPAAAMALPGVCCGQTYRLTATATDAVTNTGTTNITVYADAVPPVIGFTPLTDGEITNSLSGIGGSVTDDFDMVASVAFAIHELDINGGSGRWWNGTNFQGIYITLPASVSGTNWFPGAGVELPALNSGQSYQLTAIATDTTSNSASTSITIQAPIVVLSWDPGQTPGGTAVLTNPNTNGGNYWFKIIPQSPAVGVWRTALNVMAGQAGVYLRQGSPPTTGDYNFASANAGSNGFVLDASQFSPGQNWYVLVNASANAQWTLVSGDVFVYNLGSLAADNSSSTNVPIGSEGMVFFQTTIPSTSLAWQLWLNGQPNAIYVKKSLAPDALSHDLLQTGQMLVVPPYLASGTFNGSYFVSVPGSPGTAINFDSRQQPIISLPFSSFTNVTITATNFPYVTYQVQVPVQQIAWQLNLTPASGNPGIAVRNNLVPNEFRNDAFSETPQNVGASVTLVPPPANSSPGTPGLTDGTWYITIYGASPYSCALTNANPVVTPEPYVFQTTNDYPNRAGWRYYVLTNINQQLGSLGWALSLSNQFPGSEIAIRRNAVPGQWNYRSADDNYNYSSPGYVDLSSFYGLLQQPGHQADIWYIGVYTPTNALGNFVLTGNQLVGQPMAFDGGGNNISVTNSFPGEWQYFQIIVPADTNLSGWDVRLANVTAGDPQMVVSRDTLPTGLNSSGFTPPISTNWPSGDQWLNADWTGCGTIPVLAMGMGNPLQPGTYYVGVQDPKNFNSFTLQSRGIGPANYTIPLQVLPVTGAATNISLPAGQADYYQVIVPSNAPDWKLHLTAVSGEVLLKAQSDYLPNSEDGDTGGRYEYFSAGIWGDFQAGDGGQLMMKPGDEHWALLPYFAGNQYATNLLPGTYYVTVVSQGQNLTNNGCTGPGSGWGSGSSSYTLSSTLEPPTVLLNALSYTNDLLVTNNQAGGEAKFYQFAVPPGIASIEVTLENISGNPVMYLNSGLNLVGLPLNTYGTYGGTNQQWTSTNLITVPNPTTNYSLSVYGADSGTGTYPGASYVLRVRALPPPLVAFDGGTYAVTNQAAGTWQFFQINVPSDTNLLGWDVRLVNVTAGNPQLVVCKDALPGALSNGGPWSAPYGYPGYASSWPSGGEWLNGDWTGCNVMPMLAMGVGNPLQPGTYYIGVQDPRNASTYTLQSRGIALTNYTIVVNNLAVTGSVTNLSLTAGQADYYRVLVPTNAPHWKLHLSALAGDALLKVQRDYLPNIGQGGYGNVQGYGGGQTMMKPGDEQWSLLPYYSNGTNFLPGTYYLAAVGQGQNITNSNCNGPGSGWGSGSSSYTLNSWLEPATVLPNTLSYGNDLLFTNSQAGGELKCYQFSVPTGIPTVTVDLEDRAGNPLMYLSAGTNLTGTYPPGFSSSDGYGNYGGTGYGWRDGNLITLVNPTTNYSLTINASTTNGSEYYGDASYVLRVRAVPPPSLTFDGGTISITNQPVATWQFFQVIVPADTNLLGWDIRLTGITAGNPQMVVCRDTLPNGFGSTWSTPGERTIWPSGYQWQAGDDWTDCGGGPMLEMGVGNPLQSGTYYIGVQDPKYTSSYTIQSRGIGLSNYSIPVQNLSVSGSVTNLTLPVGQADYYQLSVPSNAPDWKLHLNLWAGDALLMVQRDYLPNSQGGGVTSGNGGQLMMKPGNEQWDLMPYYNNGTNLLPGTYYILVASQGQNLTNNCEGGGSSSYALSSVLEPVTVLPPTLSYGNDLLLTNNQAGGELKFYQFNVPSGVAALEVRLANRVGNPDMAMNTGTALVHPYDGYGNYGGVNWNYPYSGYDWLNGALITVPNPPLGAYSLSVYGEKDNSGNFLDASYVLQVHAKNPLPLSFSSELNTATLTNVVSDTLADSQHDYYQVTVPALVNGAPVLGWRLSLTALAGSPSLRVRQNLLPDPSNPCDQTGLAPGTTVIAPPYLTPGTWYVDVVASGSTTYSLITSAITTNTLAHPIWPMPALGQTNVAAGLTFPLFGDSGVDTNGNPLPGDQGIDLQQGNFDFYAVMVPTNNAGVLRTELQAISGSPNLYLRVGAAPATAGGCGSPLVDRQLTGGTTEYGNWVPLNGRYETQLTNGLWVLAVQASSNANARYRLQLECGNSITNGLVQDLALNGGSCTNQNLNGGDWRYYRVQIPDPAPTNWTVTWSRTLGSVQMFVRDTVPPGDGIQPENFSSTSYNPPWYSDQAQYLETWTGDGKNQGPYPGFTSPGLATLTTPPLRPGAVYYLGFWSPNDSTFSVSSSTNGAVIQITNNLAFFSGTVTNLIPGYGTLFYRMNVPANATRIVLNASNSSDIVFSMEQGTIANPGGPAHWVSGNQANVSLNEELFGPNRWPWLPGYSYYLAVTNTSANAEMFSVNLNLPADLSPVAFIAPANVISTRPNPSVQLVWGVTNLGVTVAGGSWYDRVWFSTNGVLDANSIDVGDFYYYGRTVLAGGSYWQTNNVTLPMTNGIYTLFLQVDEGNSLYEANLNDKISLPGVVAFTITPPDLMPVSVQAPAAIFSTNAHPAIQVTWGVTNRGTGAASGGWTDRVWFSTDGTLDAQSKDIGDFSINQTVPIGGAYWQSNIVSMPINVETYTLFVQVNIYNQLYESDVTNNVSAPFSGTILSLLPKFQTTKVTGGTIALNWIAEAGQTYQVQYLANLPSTNWINLGSPISVTNGATVTFDVIGTNKQRFYRIELSPP